jgi:hypothetical protein
MRGKLTVAAVATIVLAGGAVTLASAHPRGSSSTGKGARVIKLLEVVPANQATFLDLGTQGPSLGDQSLASGDLFPPKGGSKLGIDGVICTIVRLEQKGNAVTSQCQATASLAGGQITAQALVTSVNNQAPSPSDFAITGGTGAYAGASGQVTAEPINDTDTLLTAHLLPDSN